MIDLATCTHDLFRPHLNSTFTLAGTVRVELIAVEPLSTRPGAAREAFNLRFRSSDRSALPQQIYRLDHPVLGAMDVFLVPVGPDAVGMRYDAIFS